VDRAQHLAGLRLHLAHGRFPVEARALEQPAVMPYQALGVGQRIVRMGGQHLHLQTLHRRAGGRIGRRFPRGGRGALRRDLPPQPERQQSQGEHAHQDHPQTGASRHRMTRHRITHPRSSRSALPAGTSEPRRSAGRAARAAAVDASPDRGPCGRGRG